MTPIYPSKICFWSLMNDKLLHVTLEEKHKEHNYTIFTKNYTNIYKAKTTEISNSKMNDDADKGKTMTHCTLKNLPSKFV